MTRKRTLVGSGSAHFVTFSTHGKCRLLATSRARDVVMAELDKLARQNRVNVSGFVIMPDHVHALLWFDDDRDLPEVMKLWKTGSGRRLRKLYEEKLPGMIAHLEKVRDGRVRVSFWQTRYHDFNIVNHGKAREKLDYMHNNPVKKGLCPGAEGWRWSSYRCCYFHEEVGVKITPGF